MQISDSVKYALLSAAIGLAVFSKSVYRFTYSALETVTGGNTPQPFWYDPATGRANWGIALLHLIVATIGIILVHQLL